MHDQRPDPHDADFGLPDGYGGVAAPVPSAFDASDFPAVAAAPSRKWYWIRRGMAAAFLLLTAMILWLAFTAPLSKSLQPIVPPRLTLLSADGQPIARNGAIVERPVKATALPLHVKQSFLAIEDRRFYSHWGVDPRGLLRAAWNNLGSGGTQGGSTITQQLAKFTFLTPERSMTRKAREMLIAFWLEAWLTKDEILERYLSNAYFGDNVYGLRAASLHYFYRQPEKLTLAQGAMLAGLVQAPSRLAPTRNLAKAQKRSLMVLNAMVSAGFIPKSKADATNAAQIDVRTKNALPTGTYFADWAMPRARALTAESYSDQTIKTTLDARLQRIARGVIGRNDLGKAQVAIVAMRPNGEVVAMLGGRSYKASPFNRATQARRQPGSTFKLFVYLAALRSGMTPDTLIDDSPISEGPYRPKNYGDKYRGKITLRQAFAGSSNVAAVRLYRQLGDRAVVKAAKDLGVRSPLTADPSLALGSSGVTLLELTSAFASVSANSWPLEPHAFPAQKTGWFGAVLAPQRSFNGSTHAMLLDLLGATITEGTGKAAALGIKTYGKTGTSQDSRDALFVGFAGGLVVGVWVGNDDNTPLKGVTGGGLPARMWRDFMVQAVKGARIVPPPKPAPRVNPDGPIEPLDLPDIPDLSDLPINIGEPHVKIDKDKGVTVTTDIGGVPIDMTLGKDGFDINAGERR
jgi:penicillin-binding protein 1A